MRSYEAQLREQNDELQEEIRQLRDLLTPRIELPEQWGLTSQEDALFRHLTSRDMVSREICMAAIYGNNPEIKPKIIDVWLAHLRRKTRSSGVVIKTVWGQGWKLVDRQRWKEGDFMHAPQKTVPVTLDVPARMFAAIKERAGPMNIRPAEYARRLLDAAWLSRVKGERGEESGDAALDRQVRQAFLLADCEPEHIAAALDIPVARVEKIIAAWKSDGWREPTADGGGATATRSTRWLRAFMRRRKTCRRKRCAEFWARRQPVVSPSCRRKRLAAILSSKSATFGARENRPATSPS